MRVAPLLAIIALAAAAAPAVAQQPPRPDRASEADRLASEAAALAAAGDLPGAAARFRAAHALDPRPELLCNIGVAFHKARDLPRAHLYLGPCMTRIGSLDAGFAASVRTVFAAIEDELRAGDFAPIDVAVTPATASFTVSSFEPEDAIVGDRLIWLPFGHHTLTVHAEGHIERTIAVDIGDRAKQSVRVVVERTPVDAAPGPGPGPTPIGPVPGQRGSRTPAVAATVATGVLGVGALGVYLLARSAASDAGAAGIDATEYAERVDRARFRQHLSWGLAAGTVVGVAASSWLWYRATRTMTVTVDVAGGSEATAAIHGRF